MKYRIPKPGTTISGFADKIKKKLMPKDRPQIFLTCDRKHTYFFLWPEYYFLGTGEIFVEICETNP